MRTQGELTEKGVLDFVFPTGLPSVAQVEVAKGPDVRLGGKYRVLQLAGVLGFEINAERALGLCPGPSARGFRGRNARKQWGHLHHRTTPAGSPWTKAAKSWPPMKG